MSYLRAEIVAMIQKVAKLEGIDVELLQAICTTESSLVFDAVRFEKNYRWLHFPKKWTERMQSKLPGYSQDTEEALQKTSVGVGQVMGAVCREYGYEENLALLVAMPETALSYAARHLKKQLVRFKTESDAIASYNAGHAAKDAGGKYANQNYVDKVRKNLAVLRKLS